MPQVHHVEVDQQSDRFSADFKVRKQLCLVERKQGFYGFDLHITSPSTSKSTRYPRSIARPSYSTGRIFSVSNAMRALQLVTETNMVRPFEKARSQPTVNPVGRAQDSVRYPSVYQKSAVTTVRIRVLRGRDFGKQMTSLA